MRGFWFFLGGAAAGAGATYLILNDRYKKQYQKDWEELHARMDADTKDSVKETPDAPPTVETSTIPPKSEANVMMHKYGGESFVPTNDPFPEEAQNGVRDVGAYSEIAKKEDEDPDAHVPTSDDVPFIISEPEFSTNCLWHDKETLIYYAEDDIFTDDGDEVCEPSIRDLIGTDAIAALIYNQDTIYVRNYKAAVDYQIEYHGTKWPGA